MSAYRVRLICTAGALTLIGSLTVMVRPMDAAQRPVHLSGASTAAGTLNPLSDVALPLDVALPPQIAAGSPVTMHVHTMQGALVEVLVTYPLGVAHVIATRAGNAGNVSLTLPLPSTLAPNDTAVVRVQALLNAQHTFWQGTLAVGPPTPPTLELTPLAARLTAGYHARVAIQTAANASVHYAMGFAGARPLAAGTVTADGQGRAFVVLSTPGLITVPATLWVSAETTTSSGSSRSNVSVVLLPRPALPVAVTVATTTVDAGHPEIVSIHSVPLAQLGITIASGTNATQRRYGQTNGSGNYSFTVETSATQPRRTQVAVTVHVLSGLDNGEGGAAFVIRAAPSVVDYVKSLRAAVAGVPMNPAYATGKVIMVSLQEQALRAYENGKLELFTYVTTGRPELPTVSGVYHIYTKATPYEFHSPWPAGSRFYYPPTWIRYWMPFYEGYGLHDASWRYHYGPGTNLAGDGVASGEPTGTHGCVNIPLAATEWLWNWAPVGTTVVVY